MYRLVTRTNYVGWCSNNVNPDNSGLEDVEPIMLDQMWHNAARPKFIHKVDTPKSNLRTCQRCMSMQSLIQLLQRIPIIPLHLPKFNILHLPSASVNQCAHTKAFTLQGKKFFKSANAYLWTHAVSLGLRLTPPKATPAKFILHTFPLGKISVPVPNEA